MSERREAGRLPMPPTFSAAIFDFDGTIARTEGIWAEVDRIFFAQRGIEYTPDIGQKLSALGFAGGAYWVKERYGVKDRVEDICDEWNRLGAALYETKAQLKPGAENYLKQLRELGVPLALATTNDPDVLARMKPRVDVDALFDAVVYGKEGDRGKDHPDSYLEATSRIGVEPCGTMVFEDILTGVKSAKRAGFLACAVRSEDAHQPWDALAAEADFSIESWD